MIFYLKGCYVPKNPNKEIEPIPNGELQRKFLPQKSDAHPWAKQNWLKLGPNSKEKARKKAIISKNMTRVMRGKIYAVNPIQHGGGGICPPKVGISNYSKNHQRKGY